MSCSGRQIFLVGSNRLYNELLANLIAERTGASCSIAVTLSAVPPLRGAVPRRLIVHDFSCHPSSLDSLESLVASDRNNVIKTDYLVLTNLASSGDIEAEALQMGVRGFLYRDGGIEVLLKMVHAVLNSQLWVSRELVAELLTRREPRKHSASHDIFKVLTPREVDILHCLSEGRSNAMIADTYCLSPHTVKTHIYNIYKKIHVTSRLQAAQWASRNC